MRLLEKTSFGSWVKCSAILVCISLIAAVSWFHSEDEQARLSVNIYQRSSLATQIKGSYSGHDPSSPLHGPATPLPTEHEVPETHHASEAPEVEFSLPFHLLMAESTVCSKSISGCTGCQKMRPMMEILKGRGNSSASAQVFFVPLDPLVELRASKPEYFSLMDSLMKDLEVDQGFMRFGGSDHVFLCFSEGCLELMKELTQKYSLGRNTRAIWIGPRAGESVLGKEWPCPDRVLYAPENLMESLGFSIASTSCMEPNIQDVQKGIDDLLKMTFSKIEGVKRWECSRKKWKVDLTPYKDKDHQGCILVPQHKLCVSGIPKCGSSTMTIFLRRLNGIRGWNETHGQTHNINLNGLKWVNAKRNFTLYDSVMRDPGWIKVTVLREPARRFLSAYLDKIVHTKEYGRIGYSGKTMPSFEYVLDHFVSLKKQNKLHLSDLHFRPMSEFASLRRYRFDFVARLDSLSDDLEDFLGSLGLWEEYGMSGWGKSGDLSFGDYKGKNAGVSPKGDYINNQTLKKIYYVYEEDYARLGFSMMDTWGVDPKEF